MSDQLLSRFYPPAAVNSLPFEILCYIFRFYLVGQERSPHAISIRRHRFSFSQVCVRWRNAALTDPFLWTSPDWNVNPPFLEEMINRSKGLPLDVYACKVRRDVHLQKLAQVVNRERERIRVLQLSDALTDWSNVTRVEGSFPLMEELILQVSAAEVYNMRELLAEDFESCFPWKFRINDAPKLRRLRLRNVTLDWHFINLSMLRDLALHAVDFRYSSVARIRLTQLLDILIGTSNLERLTLECVLRPGGDGLVDRPPVPLRHLKSIVVHEGTLLVSMLLLKLRLPVTTYVQFTPNYNDFRLRPFFTNFFGVALLTCCGDDFFERNHVGRFRIAQWHSSFDISDKHGRCTVSLRNVRTLPDFLSDTAEIVGLRTRVLELTCEQFVRRWRWSEVFEALVDAFELRVDWRSLELVLESLVEDAEPPFLPSLKRLRVCCAGRNKAACHKILISRLKQRRDQGHPITELVLVKNRTEEEDFDSSLLSELRDIVPIVILDP